MIRLVFKKYIFVTISLLVLALAISSIYLLVKKQESGLCGLCGEKKEELMTVKVFFGNSQKDPEVMDCTKVFPIKREIPKTKAVARATLEELLKGPTAVEKEAGYFTSINPGVKIQSLTIKEGIARVDFDEQLEYRIGGSCWVAAIRSQITQTLKQFPTVNNVTISINGRTEDILQP